MGELIRIKDEIAMKNPMTVIQQIDAYAQKVGYVKKNGGYFSREGKFVGSLYDIGREAKIDMGYK